MANKNKDSDLTEEAKMYYAYIPSRKKGYPRHYGRIKTDRYGDEYVEEISTPDRMGSTARVMLDKPKKKKDKKKKTYRSVTAQEQLRKKRKRGTDRYKGGGAVRQGRGMGAALRGGGAVTRS
jgi:hypothetical protein